MKRALGLSLLVCALMIVTAIPATAGGIGKAAHEGIANNLGVRWQQPVANARVGDKVDAVIIAPAKLQRFGMNTKANDRIIVTRAGQNKIVVRDVTGRQQLTFTFNSDGMLTPAR